MYSRPCDKVLIDGEKVCPSHKGKKAKSFDALWSWTCQAHIQKCGTGLDPARSKKDLKCGEFCKENDLYCKAHYKTATKVKDPIMRCVKVRAKPNLAQRKLLEKFMGDERKTKNLMVEERLEQVFLGTMSIKDKTKLEGEFKKKHVTDCESYLKETPKDIRSKAVEQYMSDVCIAFNRYTKLQDIEKYKTENWENYKPKKIKLPVMQFHRKRDQQCIGLPSKNTSVTKIGETRIGIRVYPDYIEDPIPLSSRAYRNKTLKGILATGIQYDYKLLKTKTGKYYFCFPYAAKISPTTSTKQAACDGGVRNFQTVYSPQGELIQYGHHANKPIREIQDKIQFLRIASNLDGIKFKYSIRHKRALLQEKLKNLVNDLHHKTANSLCERYGTIILPHYGTASMVRSGKISPSVKRETLALSHATFRKRLISKAETRACVLLIPRNETGTTMTCGICFYENRDVGSSEVFHCRKCGLVSGRDVNAPRNIFLRQLEF